MFDASLHADVIRRSHSGGSAMPPAFLDIVAVRSTPRYCDCARVKRSKSSVVE